MQATFLIFDCKDTEAGKLTVEMILDLPRRAHLRKHGNWWENLPPSILIRLFPPLDGCLVEARACAQQCILFAVYLDAPSCIKLCIDSLTKLDLSRFSIQDVEALLDLPGA
eukprot:1140010-Pelagomonas_calceolata.AAC.1